MKKIKLLPYTLAAVIFLLTVSLNGQPVTYMQEFDMPGEGVFLSSHIGTYDGGTMVLASSYNTISSAQSITFVKTSATGTVQWSRRFSPVGADYGNFVQAADSGYFLGYVERISGTAVYQVLKLNANGNIMFSKRLDVPVQYTILGEPRSIAKNDGGFYVACDLLDTLTSERLWHLFEINPSGNLAWSHCYNITPAKGRFADIDTCSNGDIILAGTWHNAVTSVNEAVITRIAPGGAELWTRRYNCAGRSMYSTAVSCMPGDQILLLAATWGPVTMQEELALMKTDGQGNELWTFAFSNNAVALESITLERVENDRAVLLAVMAAGSLMIKTDSIGLLLCSRLYPTCLFTSMDTLANQVYSFTGMSFTSSYAVLMTSNQCGASCSDSGITIIKTPLTVQSTPAGMNVAFSLVQGPSLPPVVIPTIHIIEVCNTLGIDEESVRNNIQVYPVPSGNSIHVMSQTIVSDMELTDVSGRTIQNIPVNATAFDIDVSDLPSGVYFLRLSCDNGISTQKIIVEH